jgi:hypothetical protein
MKQNEEAAKTVIQRVGVARRQRQRADASLKRGAVAEIEAGEERRVITEKRDDRERC